MDHFLILMSNMHSLHKIRMCESGFRYSSIRIIRIPVSEPIKSTSTNKKDYYSIKLYQYEFC